MKSKTTKAAGKASLDPLVRRCECGAEMLRIDSGHWICAAIRMEIKAAIAEALNPPNTRIADSGGAKPEGRT